jgi:hypothetical protein
VVSIGRISSAPFGACAPTPLSIITKVASVTVHTSVDALPRVIVLGAAEKVMTGAASRVTVTCAEEEPPGPVALSLYVVVAAGETDVDPEAGRLPMP